MENSGESGDDGGPLGPTAFLGGSGVSTSYISVQSDEMDGRAEIVLNTFFLNCR